MGWGPTCGRTRWQKAVFSGRFSVGFARQGRPGRWFGPRFTGIFPPRAKTSGGLWFHYWSSFIRKREVANLALCTLCAEGVNLSDTTYTFSDI